MLKLHCVTGSELVDFQGSSPTMVIHPHMQEGRQRWQEAHIHKQELLAKLKHEKEAHNRWKYSQVTPRVTWRHCLRVQVCH